MAPVTDLPKPQTKADWAYAMLVAMGIDPRNNPNSVAALIAQQNAEGTTGDLWNNPLAVTVSYTGSPNGGPQNSAGVLKFTDWRDGVENNALFMAKNDPQLIQVLSQNVSVKDYGAALENADWEALGGSKSPANVAYGQHVAQDASNGGGLSDAYKQVDPTGAIGQALNVLKDVGKVATTPGLGLASAAGLLTGTSFASWFGLGNVSWTQIGGMALAIVLVFIGVWIMFHSDIQNAAKSISQSAPAVVPV